MRLRPGAVTIQGSLKSKFPAPETIVSALLAWFPRHCRDLPWRRTQDPYAIWISEIMLQQTQVQTVIPYWERWMRTLPNVQALARSRPERVLKLWEGLGYYTRARNLQRAALGIVQEHGGTFPRNHAAVLSLPGIGRYTAGAICSIAFDQPTPILDGNVIRVLSRVWGIADEVRSGPIQAQLWNLSENLVRRAAELQPAEKRPCSTLNQSLMELGALICTPRAPRCAQCPLSASCQAKQMERTHLLPTLGKRVAMTQRRFAAFVLWRNGRVLVRQRPPGVVNAGLWEFPNLEVNGSGRSLAELARQCLGAEVGSIEVLGKIRHSITRYRIELDVHAAQLQSSRPPGLAPGRWCTLAEIEARALPSAHRRILKLLRQPAGKSTPARLSLSAAGD